MVNNHFQLIGHLVQDCQERQTKNSQKRLYVTRIAVKDREETLFFNLKIWGELGTRFSDWVKKGDKVIVEGRISYREVESVTDRGDFKTVYYDFIVNSFEMMSKREKETSQTRPEPNALTDEDFTEEDCPF